MKLKSGAENKQTRGFSNRSTAPVYGTHLRMTSLCLEARFGDFGTISLDHTHFDGWLQRVIYPISVGLNAKL